MYKIFVLLQPKFGVTKGWRIHITLSLAKYRQILDKIRLWMNKVWQSMQFHQIRQTLAITNFYCLQDILFFAGNQCIWFQRPSENECYHSSYDS